MQPTPIGLAVVFSEVSSAAFSAVSPMVVTAMVIRRRPHLPLHITVITTVDTVTVATVIPHRRRPRRHITMAVMAVMAIRRRPRPRRRRIMVVATVMATAASVAETPVFPQSPAPQRRGLFF